MNLIQAPIRKVYLHYLLAALGSTIILSIYSTVDMIAVGHYAGPDGTAALSCVTPLWTITIGLGLLFGIGGSVRMSLARGEGRPEQGDRWFSLTLLVGLIAAALVTACFAFFLDDMLRFFGADVSLLPLARQYAQWLIWSAPAFLLGPMLTSFVRNDGAPFLCTAAVVCGGVLNIIGDYVLVFPLDLGLSGAGLATAAGQYLSLLILCTHFRSKDCRLRLARPTHGLRGLGRICTTGFAPFLVEVSFGITVILFNRQIMARAGAAELAVFGTVINCAILFQSLFNGVGQGVQPILSVNCGAGEDGRVQAVRKMALMTAAGMGLLFFSLSALFPTFILRMFMDVTPAVLDIGPAILRTYAVSFLFMGINVVTSYYLQSLLRTVPSVSISLARGVVLPAALVMTLPALFGFSAIWWAMPAAELLTLALALIFLRRCQPGGGEAPARCPT